MDEVDYVRFQLSIEEIDATRLWFPRAWVDQAMRVAEEIMKK